MEGPSICMQNKVIQQPSITVINSNNLVRSSHALNTKETPLQRINFHLDGGGEFRESLVKVF